MVPILPVFYSSCSAAERDLEWSDQGVEGAYRFLSRLWRIIGYFGPLVGTREDGYDVDET